MKEYKRSITIVVILIFMHLYGGLLAQCNDKIKITEVVADQEKATGQFDVTVVAEGSFKGQLISIEGTNEVIAESFWGTGAKSFTFAELNLSKINFYRVVIEFADEQKFLCKRRVKDIVIPDIK
jgi:hypothetical protein